MGILDRALNVGEGKQFRRYEQRVAEINAFEPELELDTDEELRERIDALRERARGGESLDDLLPECFAIVREAGKRHMGMRHFDVQLIGGMVLHGGSIAEMRTGEGKTLTATLAVVLNTLAGKGVHVVTVNDYLARRDAEWMTPLYEALGVTVGVLQSQQPTEEKIDAYACDVTYGTNSEFGFDYLRDNMAASLEEKVQNGGRRDENGRPITAHTLRDRRRGRQHPDRRGAHAADHQRRARAGGRPLRHSSRDSRPTMVAGKTPEGLDPRTKKEFVADFDYEFDEKYKTVAVTELGVAKAERFLGIDHLYRAENGHARQPPDPVAEGRVALQARRRLRRSSTARSRSSTSSPDARSRAAAGRRACTRRSRPRRACASRRRTRRSRRSRCRTTSASTTSSPA